MGNLVIVESPTKAKTITRFLGNGVQVIASQGHVRDLPERAIGVDIANNFTPVYELTSNGKRIVPTLKKAAQQATEIYLATDPDREGEAISWHLYEVLKASTKAKFHRITFHEITNSAIQNSLQHPGALDVCMVDAQQARRVLDRIVGYQVSPMLWRTIHGGTSAGRVQTVALRLVVEREREIQNFKPVESWNLEGKFDTMNTANSASLKARLVTINGNNIKVSNGADAERLAAAVQSGGVRHSVVKVTSTPRMKNPAPPFITSTLQQSAGSNLGLGASQTMRIAQELYEGINLGNGQVGLITYMRTDSFNIAKEAQAQALQFIEANYGKEYLPAKPNYYRSGKNAQEAHEAIRPTDMNYAPHLIQQYLTPQQLKVYTLIWNRFLASQMAPAKQMDHLVEVESRGGALDSFSAEGLLANKSLETSKTGCTCQFRATARETIFPGFMKAYNFREIGEEDDPALNTLPKPDIGTECLLNELSKEQTFSQPPPRYSEATLVKALEQNGVGRPSTYATTVNTIQERAYVEKDRKALKPTELGFKVCDFLTTQIKNLFEVRFTAEMETQLDQIEEGKVNWTNMLRDFYGNFQQWLGMKPLDASSPITTKVSAILDCFPEGFKFAEPAKIGTKKYDDAKFLSSIRTRLEGNNALTSKQWKALLTTALKYSDEHPEIMSKLEALGLSDELAPLIEERKKALETPVEVVCPDTLELLGIMMEKANFQEPVKRTGKRVYDDGKFVKSLYNQAKGGKALSQPQTSALLKLASHYQVDLGKDYARLVEAISKTLPESENAGVGDVAEQAPVEVSVSAEELESYKVIVEMLAEIKEWKPARGRFNDETFAKSVSDQFHHKNSLSAKQASAVLKMVSKYSEQIYDYDNRIKNVKIAETASKTQPKLLEEKCPLCGAQLITRFSRGRSFVGCSAFPKCRYIKK